MTKIFEGIMSYAREQASNWPSMSFEILRMLQSQQTLTTSQVSLCNHIALILMDLMEALHFGRSCIIVKYETIDCVVDFRPSAFSRIAINLRV